MKRHTDIPISVTKHTQICMLYKKQKQTSKLKFASVFI
ncbi:hypothetical protein PARMER_02145 [Parabacteroides merdae ATCC 43184]|nr:hypothetical protein PARMER_02145 [Parabacteroides merdae ATCC 43184]